MSILINMEMPKCCRECRFRKTELQEDPDWCLISGESLFYLAENDCPLIEVPPHGDLIDRDALKLDFLNRGIEGIQTDDFSELQQTIDDAPTVIPADKDGET